MGAWFEVIFRMSLTASFVIAAVFLIRVLLIRVPRRYSYLLWLVVIIRLLCPAVMETRFGLIPDMEEVLGGNLAEERENTKEQDRYMGMTPDDIGVSGEQLEDGGLLINVQGTVVEADMSALSGYDEWKARAQSEEDAETADVPDGAGFRLGTWRISEAAGNIIGWVWLCGCLIFGGCGIWSYLRLLYRLRGNKKSSFNMEDSRHAAGTKFRFSA